MWWVPNEFIWRYFFNRCQQLASSIKFHFIPAFLLNSGAHRIFKQDVTFPFSFNPKCLNFLQCKGEFSLYPSLSLFLYPMQRVRRVFGHGHLSVYSMADLFIGRRCVFVIGIYSMTNLFTCNDSILIRINR